ncbi:TorF family putative porin [Dyella solisilvae]|nr:TorF family putative porin [Dyella solisilvae]
MRKTLCVALAALLVGPASLAFAQDAAGPTQSDDFVAPPLPPAAPSPGWQVAFNFGAQTDCAFRGISQTNERPSGFAGLDVAYGSQWYVGTWTSNVDFSPSGDTSTSQEIDLYGGWRPTIATINLDLGYIHYSYLNQPSAVRESYEEAYLRGTKTLGAFTLGGSAYYSPRFPGNAGHAWYGEANLAYAINPDWTASAAFGRQTIAHDVSHPDGSTTRFAYNTWNLGVTWAINAHTSLDLRYWDTDTHASGSIYGSRLIAGLKATF